MTTLRHAEANRQNARKSTGPRTAEGKAASRRNALKHGVTGRGLVVPEEIAEEVERRFAEWAPGLRTGDPRDDWRVEVAVLESVRVERCRGLERAHLIAVARRAEVAWDSDRRLAAERLAEGLRHKPARVRRELEATAQGCDVLIDRWEHLAACSRAGLAWDDAQRATALDLLGTPAEFRSGPSRLDPEFGQSAAEAEADLAASELSRLRLTKSSWLDELDAEECDRTVLGLTLPDRDLMRLLTYEERSQRRMYAALNYLVKARDGQGIPGRGPDGSSPLPSTDRAPAPTPEPSSPSPTWWHDSLEMFRASLTPPVSTPSEPEPEPEPAPARGNRRHRKAQARRARQAVG